MKRTAAAFTSRCAVVLGQSFLKGDHQSMGAGWILLRQYSHVAIPADDAFPGWSSRLWFTCTSRWQQCCRCLLCCANDAVVYVCWEVVTREMISSGSLRIDLNLTSGFPDRAEPCDKAGFWCYCWPRKGGVRNFFDFDFWRFCLPPPTAIPLLFFRLVLACLSCSFFSIHLQFLSPFGWFRFSSWLTLPPVPFWLYLRETTLKLICAIDDVNRPVLPVPGNSLSSMSSSSSIFRANFRTTRQTKTKIIIKKTRKDKHRRRRWRGSERQRALCLMVLERLNLLIRFIELFG